MHGNIFKTIEFSRFELLLNSLNYMKNYVLCEQNELHNMCNSLLAIMANMASRLALIVSSTVGGINEHNSIVNKCLCR